MSAKDVALLVAESPWYTPNVNQGAASSLPFFEGVKKLNNDSATDRRFNIYHCNFYDNSSFDSAIEHLAKASEERQILYVGAHGSAESIAGAEIEHIADVVADAGGRIKGLIVSSCFVGSNDKVAKASELGFKPNTFKEVRGPNWILAYKYSVDWLSSVMLETSVIHHFSMAYMEGTINSKAQILDVFNNALALFNPNANFGRDSDKHDVTLAECIRVWVRPQGAEFAKDVTEELALFTEYDEDYDE